MIIAQVCQNATLKCAVLLYWGGSKTSQYLVWPPFASRSAKTSSHRVDQVGDCGLWNVGPILFNGCANLLDIGRNWNTLSYTSIQSILNMLNGWHVRWEYAGQARTWMFSAYRNCVQILATWGDGRGWMALQWASGSHHSISVHSKCHQ